jgi:rubrerythrin
MKPTKNWLMEQIKDEKMASKMYLKRGFPQIARDERKHMKILKKKLKKVI